LLSSKGFLHAAGVYDYRIFSTTFAVEVTVEIEARAAHLSLLRP